MEAKVIFFFNICYSELLQIAQRLEDKTLLKSAGTTPTATMTSVKATMTLLVFGFHRHEYMCALSNVPRTIV